MIYKKRDIFEVKRLSALAEFRILLNLSDPDINQVQSSAGPVRWISQMCHWEAPCLAAPYDYFEKKKLPRETGKIADYDLCVWEVSLGRPRFRAPMSFSGNRSDIEINTDACATPSRNGRYRMGIWSMYMGNPHYKRGRLRIFPDVG